MLSNETKSVADRAKQFFEASLRTVLEQEHCDKFVAIEPDSQDYFIADSFGEAIAASREAHPTRIAFVIRIGHKAAIHIGAISS